MSETITVPALTTRQMQEVDRLMIEEYHIELIQMMENAGRNLARLAKHLLDEDIEDRPIVVLAGRGNNGGGGLVAARHLLNWGAWVQIVPSYPFDDYRGVPKHQLEILQRMGAPLAWAEDGWELPPSDLIIDAVIGYGLRGDPRGNARNLILLANSSNAPILSLDTPSGVDTAGGQVFSPQMRAAATMTLALPKTGLLQPHALAACGDLYLADISVPPELYAHLDLEVPPLFARDTLLPLHVENGVASVQVDD